jgi:DnaJ domain
MNDDPFAVLGVSDDADDETVKRRYLALVRAFPPDREPERFQAFRRAYEAISGKRERLERKLLHTSTAALSRLKLHCLAMSGSQQQRPSQATVTAVLLQGLQHVEG